VLIVRENLEGTLLDFSRLTPEIWRKSGSRSAKGCMNTTEIFLIAMAIIFTLPWLIWRIGRTDYYAPLVVVQIITGILLGPGILGRFYPDGYCLRLQPGGRPVAQRHCLVGGDAVRDDRRRRTRPQDRPGHIVARAASPPDWRSARRCCSAAWRPV
jgi:hypothetical protein